MARGGETGTGLAKLEALRMITPREGKSASGPTAVDGLATPANSKERLDLPDRLSFSGGSPAPRWIETVRSYGTRGDRGGDATPSPTQPKVFDPMVDESPEVETGHCSRSWRWRIQGCDIAVEESSGNTVALVVDDDPGMRELCREFLQRDGFQVETAANGREALAALPEVKPDVVLLDVVMPGMDGYEVCRRIRRDPKVSRLPILILTGLGDHDSLERAYEAGATDFATKPPNWQLLCHRVRYLLRSSQAAERALVNEARLEEAQRVAHIGNWEWWRADNRLYWSDEVYRIFGLEPGESAIDAQAFLSRVHVLDRPRVETQIRNAMAEHAGYSVDFRIVRPDGEERFVEARGRVMEDPLSGRVRMLGTVQDSTDQWRMREKLRIAHERLELAQEIARTGSFEYHFDTGRHIWSDQMLNLYALGRDEFHGRYQDWAGRIHPDDREQVTEVFAMVPERNTLDAHWRVIWPDGSVHWLEAAGRMVSGPDGNPCCMIGVNVDATAHKEAEQRILRLLEENRRLIGQNIKLQEEERLHLARELHDEMGQQVTAMRMDVGMIRDACRVKSSPVLDYVADIERIASELIRTMRSVTNRLRPANLDYLGLKDTLQDSLHQWSSKHPKIEVHADFEGELGDFSEEVNIAIYRIFQECLTNIAKYSSASRVDIAMRRMGQSGGANRLELRISDNGKGVKLADSMASGVGIVGMRERARILGGEFDFQSAPGCGTKVSVDIPMSIDGDRASASER